MFTPIADRMKIKLANGCSCSTPQVSPLTWDRKNASVKKPWYIHFRFYDPAYADRYPEGYQKKIKRMNDYHTLAERQDATKELLDALLDALKNQDYNPISGYTRPPEAEQQPQLISLNTGMLAALQFAYEKKKATNGVKKDLRSVLKYVSMAAKEIHIDEMPIKDVGRRHIKSLLEQTGKLKQRLETQRYNEAKKKPKARPSELIKRDVWTENNFNFYRSHLMMLFEELCEWEVFENNPVEKIKKEKHVCAPRKTLTDEQRIAIDRDLYNDNYRFWRLMHMFFGSGARETEMVRVKWDDVHLRKQEVTFKILKGSSYRLENKPIPIDLLPLWQEVMAEAKPGQYLFGEDLVPDVVPISASNAFTRRWKRWIKDKKNEFGEKKYGDEVADMYSLKHSHTSELVELVGTKLAAKHNSHTEAVLKKHYNVKGKDQEMQILKGTVISFVPNKAKTG